MNITIKPLSPELVDDFFDFFDNRAFTDNSPMRPCYCCRPQMSVEQEQAELVSLLKRNAGVMPRDIPEFMTTLRKITEKQIQAGALRGYLAFDAGIAIGWCNANNKANYTPLGISDGIMSAYVSKPNECVKSVVCFEIAPHYRGQGIATALLNRVYEDAKAEGYDAVEGYPQVHGHREIFDFTGPVRLYEKAGFVKVGEKGNVVIMRRGDMGSGLIY